MEEDRKTHGQEQTGELMELSHAAVPGYTTAFRIVFLAGALYLALAIARVF